MLKGLILSVFLYFYLFIILDAVLCLTDVLSFSCPLLKREPDCEEQPDDNMPPKFKRHLNDDEVTGSIRSERVRPKCLGVLDLGEVLGVRVQYLSIQWLLLLSLIIDFPYFGSYLVYTCEMLRTVII